MKWTKRLLTASAMASLFVMIVNPPPTAQAEKSVITAAAPNYVVSFKDLHLEKVVRQALNKPTEKITAQDLSQLTSIAATDYVTSLEGLEFATNLTEITIRTSILSDLTPLQHLQNLKHIDITSCRIQDLTPLANLTSLEYLSLDGNFISDLTPLENLSSLNLLSLNNNNISDVSPLSALPSLELLFVNDNYIEHLNGNWESSKLYGLHAGGNLIQELSSFAAVDSLKSISFASNPVTDLSPLQSLSLEAIQLDHTDISDLIPLSNMPSLKYIYLYNNPLSESSKAFLEAFKKQEGTEVYESRYSSMYALPKVFVDGEVRTFNTMHPMIHNDSTMLPLRELFNIFGADVHWDGATRSVTATLGEKTIKLTIGSKVALVNNKPVTLVTEPILFKDYTMIPFRFVAEAFGYEVKWDDKTHWVTIHTRNEVQ